MAIVVGAIAGYAASEMVAAAVVGEVIAGMTISALGAAVIGGVAGMAVSGIITSAFSDQRNPNRNDAAEQRRAESNLVTLGSTTEPIPVVYGYRRVGGKVFYREICGDRNQFFILGIAISEGPIAGIDMMYIDGVPWTDTPFRGLVEFETHTGEDAQAPSELFGSYVPGKFESTDNGAGIAYAVVVLARTADEGRAHFSGEPQFTFDVRGRLLYDTRDAGTRFSNNPAAVIRDYWTNTRYGRSIPTAAVLDSTFTDVANYNDDRISVPAYTVDFTVADPESDEISFEEDQPFDNLDGIRFTTTVALPAGLSLATTYYVRRITAQRFKLASSVANVLAETFIDITDAGSGTHTASHYDQPRYTCNGVVDVDNDPIDTLVRLRSSCQAWLFDCAGQYRLVSDRDVAAVSPTLTRDNMIGAWKISGRGKEGRYNRVKARFLDPAQSWEQNYAIADSAADRTADGGALLQATLELDFTTNLYMARRIASLEQRKSRLTLSTTVKTSLETFKVEAANVVEITHSVPGWAGQQFRVTRIGLGESGELEYDLREYADIWTGLSPGDAFTPPSRTNLPSPQDYIPLRVSGLELFEQGNDTVFTGPEPTFVWRSNSAFNVSGLGAQAAGDDQRDPWVNGWWVNIVNPGASVYRKGIAVSSPEYTYSLLENIQDATRLGESGPAREFEIFVSARSRYGKGSAIPARLAVSNAAPSITDFTVTAIDRGFTFAYTMTDSDFSHIEIYASRTSGFVPGADTLVYKGSKTAGSIGPLLGGRRYYYRFIASDVFGPAAASTEASVVTLNHNALIAASNWFSRTTGADNSWTAVAWSPALGMFAAVSSTGTGNRVMTSYDGITWTARTSAADSGWQDIVWADSLGLFVAVAGSGANRVMTSPDGINWTARTASNASQWNALEWASSLGLLVAISLNSLDAYQVMTSTDGITWNNQNAASASAWRGIGWSQDLTLFVAVGNNCVMTSPDGTTWTSRTPAANLTWMDVEWSPTLALFAASASSGVGNRVMTSPNGIDWTSRESAIDTNPWDPMIWAEELGLFICAALNGVAGAVGAVMVSSDGIEWESKAVQPSAWRGLAWSPDLLTIAAVSFTSPGNIAMSSQFYKE